MNVKTIGGDGGGDWSTHDTRGDNNSGLSGWSGVIMRWHDSEITVVTINRIPELLEGSNNP